LLIAQNPRVGWCYINDYIIILL